jgi:hypothetical protein
MSLKFLFSVWLRPTRKHGISGLKVHMVQTCPVAIRKVRDLSVSGVFLQDMSVGYFLSVLLWWFLLCPFKPDVLLVF